MSDEMKLRIESDGTVRGTNVFAVDSQGRKSRISKVVGLYVRGEVGDRITAEIEVLNPELDMEIIDGKVKFEGSI